MSHSGGINALQSAGTATSTHTLKRKRPSPELEHDHPSKSCHSTPHHPSSAMATTTGTGHGHGHGNGANQYISPASDDHDHGEGDMVRGVGSASSLGSTASSVFTHNSATFAHNQEQSLSSRKASAINGLTPLTNHAESSPPKGANSPQYYATSYSAAEMAVTAADDAVASSHVLAAASSTEPIPKRTPRPQMLPPLGTVKGYKAVWDPELDNKLSKEERKRATFRKKDFGAEAYEPDPPPDPRLAIPGYMSGQCRPRNAPSKAIMRIAPYTIPPYKLDRNSVGAGEAQQVVAVGFDPFLPESTLRVNFSTFGTIQSIQNKTDPETGSFLGIALIKYKDDALHGQEVTAVSAAKRAEAEFNGGRIGLHTIKVELDREGRRCKRHVEHVLKKSREERAKHAPPPPPAPVEVAAKDSPAPPPNAPKGPSGRNKAKQVGKPPAGPRGSVAAAQAATPTPVPEAASNPRVGSGPNNGIEDVPILSQIKRKPYIHIPNHSVPVLPTTIPHLKKRLKAYDWREVRVDSTGYYVIFEDSKRGEDETERCFTECNKGALFTYKMGMECQKYGNPDYERSPSPERAMADKQKREIMQRLQREEAEDLEIEKKNRAENLDPVQGALDQLRIELRDKIMSDIKTRIAIPIFHDSLDPSRHAAKRRKLGLPDPSDKENKGSVFLLNKAGDTPPDTPKSRRGHPLSHSKKPLRPHDPNQQRGRRGGRDREPSNAFADERRRNKPAPRPSHARGLHFRLQQMYAEEEDSDDERHTSITRDTEDQESRPLSRASRNSTPFDSESVADADTPKHKRRKVDDWDQEEDETFDAFHKEMLGHLLHKQPEDLATRELELVVNTLPRTSKYGMRAKTELFIRQRSKADDDLFQVKTEAKKEVGITLEGVVHDAARKELESTPSVAGDVDTGVVKEKRIRKRPKSKKQIFEEREALKAAARTAKDAGKPVTEETVSKIEQKELEIEEIEQDEARDKDVTLHLTYDKPRRTVEEDRSILLDIDGWQQYVKDEEDMALLSIALQQQNAYDIGDAKLWAWKQKEIKALNSGTGVPGVSKPLISGYYVPNASGCARTEGVKKILNEEKSKYLPHRIKVQKAREERQAEATANPTADADAAKAAKIVAAEKIASTATSRSNRVNNRRLINDINLQKQALATANSDADVAIRFNQLKKRKKLVKFDRSAIHGWGLYAEENIAVNDLIIEYVGEKVRQKVADMRELRYEKQGVGSSYLFRMIDDEIVDATKKGGIARFINHSCSPNCTAKIIKVEGTPRIVIYALKDIGKNDELTYDYKFEREYGSTDRIPCLCGSANCKGFLN